jgi:hypothetical protein
VVERGEGEIHRRRLGAPVADQVGAVVTDGVVAGVAVGERVALPAAQDGVELGEPGEVAADPAGVRAPGRRRERLGLQVGAVALEPVRQVLVQASDMGAGRSRPDRHPARLLLLEVLVGR